MDDLLPSLVVLDPLVNARFGVREYVSRPALKLGDISSSSVALIDSKATGISLGLNDKYLLTDRTVSEWRSIFLTHRDPAFKPSRTAMGARLRSIRRAALVSNERLLSWAEIDNVLDRRRND